MTLATILSICILCSAVRGELVFAQIGGGSPNTPLAANQDNAASSQSAPASPTSTPSVSSPAQLSKGQNEAKVPKSKQRNRKKSKAANAPPNASANCTPSATSNTAAAGTTSTGSTATPVAQANSAPTNGTLAPSNCAPEKKVVHDGGTTEAPVQLVGGPGGAQASQQRDTTDQLLGSVESNLKQVAGRQLNSSQQEMMTQIQQFIEQSKAAVAAGDMERGHNLAMKANLLSAELLKP